MGVSFEEIDQTLRDIQPPISLDAHFDEESGSNLYLLSEIARKNGGKVEARSWLPVGLRRDTYFGISLTSQEE